ncbi:hypothetical protein YYE_04408 [Plasmodium vinckei vinckei]|uniref:CIR protein PIR protein n=1 Tax=Plasmodium vinckei vinckei TaxID=54757 RepID=A0A081IA71_PLAVN|nr:hypothetical protein YYE_04408 [Plasmodium vinckei vinckei]
MENGISTQFANTEINKYCHYGDTSGDGRCINYFQMASSGVIHLLINLKKYGLDDDKLAEYAILWLSYKLNEKPINKKTNLNDFYTNHIEKNNDYKKKINSDNGPTYKAIIDKKKDLMCMDNNEISKFNDLFKILYFIYHTFTKTDIGCEGNLSLAKNFADEFEKLNNDSNINGNPSYSKLLSTLSNDYDNLKKKCTNFKSLPEIKTSQSSAQNSLESSEEKSGKSSEEKSVPESVPEFVTESGKDSEKLSVQSITLSPEGTSSSSSILNTVIPGLSTFAIPVFLGVAYKVNNNELKTIIFKLYSLNTCKL